MFTVIVREADFLKASWEPYASELARNMLRPSDGVRTLHSRNAEPLEWPDI